MERWMCPLLSSLSPSSLIFCQHKLWRVTHGNKEAEWEVILLVACRSNNLFCSPSGFSRTRKAALLNASRLTLKCCFHLHIQSRVPQSLKAPVSVCHSVCVCLSVRMSVWVHGRSALSSYTHAASIKKAPLFPELEKGMFFHCKLLQMQTQAVSVEPRHQTTLRWSSVILWCRATLMNLCVCV